MTWANSSGGAVATDPREYDLFYLAPDDPQPAGWAGPANGWKFWYADSSQPGGYRFDWANWVRQQWYDVDLTAICFPANVKAVCVGAMLDITYATNVSPPPIAEIWATVRAPSAKANALVDVTGRPYGTKTFRTICQRDGVRDMQSCWVAVEDGKISVRADYEGHGAYPAIPAYMMRLFAMAYLV